jgi:ribonuclease D
MVPVHYIQNQEDFSEVVSLLFEAKSIAVDLEFDNNLHYYGFRLCLLQIASHDSVYLIDTEKIEIKDLFPVLETEDIQKIVFSFGEDMRLLHALGCKPKNLYDIATAVKLLNFEKISLADVIQHYLEVDLKKGAQMSNWCKRPLKQEQLEYAAHDVLYLEEVRSIVHPELKTKKMDQWIAEENLDLEVKFLDKPLKINCQ